jgi:hypothetical protein
MIDRFVVPFSIVLFCTLATAGLATAESPVLQNEDDMVFLLEEYCFSCHKSSKKRGDLDLESMLKERPLVKNLDSWTSVLLRLENKEMPPAKRKSRPSDEDYTDLIHWLNPQINEFDYSKVKNPGYEGARRLTNEEYDYTVSDLMGIELRPSEKFPQDLTGTSGFSNSANTLFLQPVQLDKYFSAAEEVVVAALPETPLTDAHRRARELLLIAEPSATLSEDDAARQVLKNFLNRAYRRTASEEELNDILAHYTALRENGDTYDSSIRRTIQLVLISPSFLFRIEDVQSDDEAYRISSQDLANRLSYFLWATAPDDELMSLAAQDLLFDEETLNAQVSRMLLDRRAERLGTSFAAQWLGFDALGTRLRLDPIDNPWCTDSLMDSMRAETSLFINDLIRNDRPLQELLTADYTFLNEELANHYEVQEVYNIEGDEMRRVTLEDRNRGGILGQGSLMAITSHPGETSPVLRGFWVLDTILGTPPPPPPPSVQGEFDEKIQRNRRLTQREKLEMHRADKSCAACHDEMDPLGLSLQNFDYFGRWRERLDGDKIDASGIMASGTEFDGPSGLKKVLVSEHFDDLTRQVTKKMLSYALGRQLAWYDEPAIRTITARLEEEDYSFQTLINEVVQSYPFQYKKTPEPDA